MNRLDEIKERNQRHKDLKERGRKPIGDPMSISNFELNTLMFETKHIMDKVPEDIDALLSRLETAEKALERYANLHKLMYDDAVDGELYEHWWLRQNKHAVEALQQIRS